MSTGFIAVSLDVQTHEVITSLVDATKPTIFVLINKLADISGLALSMEEDIDGKPTAVGRVTPVLEDLRQPGAMGMRIDPDAQAEVKIASLGLALRFSSSPP